MNEFNELQQAWNQQQMATAQPSPDALLKKARQYSRTIKLKHRWAIGILSALVVLLVAYFGYAAGFTVSRASAGLLCMIFSILLRVVLEYASYNSFSRIDTGSSFKDYTAQITRFYGRRKLIHYIFTPIILLVYSLGFILLLPVFKRDLSAGFYSYVLISGIVVLVFFAWFIFKQVKKEMQLLAFLKAIE